jgi:hypothetical protein
MLKKFNAKPLIISWLSALTILIGFLAYSRLAPPKQNVAVSETVVVESRPVIITEMRPHYRVYHPYYPHHHPHCHHHPRHSTHFSFSIGGPL